MADYFASQPLVLTLQEIGLDTDTQVEEQPSLGPITPIGTPSEGAPSSNGSIIVVSCTFNFTASLGSSPPDVVIVADDQVFFAVHWQRLMAASTNGFGGMLSVEMRPQTGDTPITIIVPERSEVLNVVLHSAYDFSCDTYGPSFECLHDSLESMKKYGLVPLVRFLSKNKSLYNTILSHAPRKPLETFALAAANDLVDLAIASSAYTLHLRLHRTISMELAEKIGLVYLERLYTLHGIRMDALKQLLGETVVPHADKPYCSVEQRQVLSGAYRLAAAQLFYNATAALSKTAIERVMHNLADATSCPDCQESIKGHVQNMITKWLLVNRTITDPSIPHAERLS